MANDAKPFHESIVDAVNFLGTQFFGREYYVALITLADATSRSKIAANHDVIETIFRDAFGMKVVHPSTLFSHIAAEKARVAAEKAAKDAKKDEEVGSASTLPRSAIWAEEKSEHGVVQPKKAGKKVSPDCRCPLRGKKS